MNFLHNLSTQTASVRMNMKFYRLPIRQFRSRRGLFATVVMTTTLLLMTSLELRRNTNSRRIHDKVPSSLLLLPAMPSSDNEIMVNLFDFLTADRSSERVCQRLVRLGGKSKLLGSSSAVIVGDHVACVDPAFSMARADCHAVSLTGCEDRSFALAAELFGCHVLAAPQCLAPEAPLANSPPVSISSHSSSASPAPVLNTLKSTNATTSPDSGSLTDQLFHVDRQLTLRYWPTPPPTVHYLAINAPAEEVLRLMESAAEHGSVLNSVWSHVEQLGLLLNLTDGVDIQRRHGPRRYWVDLQFGRRLYKSLRQLQQFGLVMYDVESVRTLESVSLRLPQRNAAIDTLLRTSWIRI